MKIQTCTEKSYMESPLPQGMLRGRRSKFTRNYIKGQDLQKNIRSQLSLIGMGCGSTTQKKFCRYGPYPFGWDLGKVNSKKCFARNLMKCPDLHIKVCLQVASHAGKVVGMGLKCQIFFCIWNCIKYSDLNRNHLWNPTPLCGVNLKEIFY